MSTRRVLRDDVESSRTVYILLTNAEFKVIRCYSGQGKIIQQNMRNKRAPTSQTMLKVFIPVYDYTEEFHGSKS